MENNKSELIKALVKFQSEVGAIKKAKDNPFFKSKYADLASFIDACRPAMVATGLVITQTTKAVDGEIVLITTLWHESGQSIESEYPVKVSHTVIHKEGKINDTRSKENGYNLTIDTIENNPQVMGSAFTYARRYCFSAILGVASEDDDDANQASEPAKQYQSPPPQNNNQKKYKRDRCPRCQAIALGDSLQGPGKHCFKAGGGCGITFHNTPENANDNNKSSDPLSILSLENQFKNLCDEHPQDRKQEFRELAGEINAAITKMDADKIEMLLKTWRARLSNGEGAKQ